MQKSTKKNPSDPLRLIERRLAIIIAAVQTLERHYRSLDDRFIRVARDQDKMIEFIGIHLRFVDGAIDRGKLVKQ